MTKYILDRLNGGVLFKLSFILFIYGFLTIPLSNIFDMSDVKLSGDFLPHGKQVGYFYAINWWPNYTLFIPALIFILGWLLKEINRLHYHLTVNGMVFDTTTKSRINSEALIQSSWQNWMGLAIKIWLVLSAVTISFSYYECWTTAIYPILNPNNALIFEADWSIAPLFKDVSEGGAITFNIIVFTMQGLGVSVALLMICITGAYGAFISQYSFSKEKWVIIPNIESTDPRKGFEHFEQVGTLILVLGLIAYMIIYFTILQNTYLNNKEFLGLFTGERALFTFNPGNAFSVFVHLNESTAITLMLGMLVIIVTMAAVPGAILSIAAKKARENYKLLLNDSEEVRLVDMTWWPYRWFKTNTLLVAISLCLIALVFPTVAPYLAGIYGTAIVGYVAFKIKSYFKTENT